MSDTYHVWLSGCGLPHSGYFFPSSIHLPTNFMTSLYFYHWVILHCAMYHIFFIHSLVEEHLGCFHIPVIMNNAAMDIVEHMSLWYDWASFGYMPKNGIAGSWGRLIPNFLRNHHIDFQSGCTSLHSHQKWRSVPLTPHPFQSRLGFVVLILSILTDVIGISDSFLLAFP